MLKTREESAGVGRMDTRARYCQKGMHFSTPQGKREEIVCKFCMKHHPFGPDLCQAWGGKCGDCGKSNHFAHSVVCSSSKKLGRQGDNQKVKAVEEHFRALFLGSVEVGSTQQGNKEIAGDPSDNWEIDLKTKFGKVLFKIDTGAEVSAVGVHHLKIWNRLEFFI